MIGILGDIYVGEVKFSRKIYSVGLGLSLPRIFAHIFSLSLLFSLFHHFLLALHNDLLERGFAQSLLFNLGGS